MELYEKIILASIVGLYLCFLIYQNRGYFIRDVSSEDEKQNENAAFQSSKTPHNVESDTQEEVVDEEEIPDNVIRIETLDGSDEFIEIIFPKEEEKESNNKNDK